MCGFIEKTQQDCKVQLPQFEHPTWEHPTSVLKTPTVTNLPLENAACLSDSKMQQNDVST
jgi:hypothetical protein